RVSVRSLIEHGPSDEKFTDTVGVLTSWDEGVLRITRRGGESVRIPESALVAGKTVPAAPARRRGPAASYGELARVASRAWPPTESARLGDWELRAAAGGPAGRRTGFTRRANSVLPLGDPGRPLDEALTAVRDWYAERGLPAYVQTATGAEGTQEVLGAELERRGRVRRGGGGSGAAAGGARHGGDGGAGPPGARRGRVGGVAAGRGGQRGRPAAVRRARLHRAPCVPPLPGGGTGTGISGSGR